MQNMLKLVSHKTFTAILALLVGAILAPQAEANITKDDGISYHYIFRGTDGNACTVGNWYTTSDNGSTWTAETGTVPGAPSSNKWDPLLFDGNYLPSGATSNIVYSSSNMEGWNGRYGAFNGVNVTINNLLKIQGGQTKCFSVDSTSKITVTTYADGNNNNSLRFLVASADGVEFSEGVTHTGTENGVAVSYVLTGAGSVKYCAACDYGASHTIQAATIEMNATPNSDGIVTKKLVSFGSSTITFSLSSAQVTCSDDNTVTPTASSAALTGAEEVGTYYLRQESDGIYLDYVIGVPAEEVACGLTYTASAANAVSTAASRIKLNFDDGATFTIDEALTRTYNLVCNGNLTLAVGTSYTPTASDLAYLKVNGVTGNLIRPWVAESNNGVYGFNFNASGARNGTRDLAYCNETSIALEIGAWAYDLHAVSGSTNFFSDGFSTLTWSAKNVYSEEAGCSGSFIKGYLDDGNGIDITISRIPYESYDVIIYCSTDDSTKSFTAKTVNGTIYAWDDATSSVVVTNSTTAVWGLASKAAGKAVYGANTIRVNGLSGALTLNSVVQVVSGSNGARGCISAIQIMPAGTSTAPTLTLAEDANWTTAANWNTANIPTSGPVIINVTGDVVLTVDEAIALGTVAVTGTGSLKIFSDAYTSTIENITSEVPITIAGTKISAPSIYADATWECQVNAITTTSSYDYTYAGGAGSASDGVTNAVQIALAGGAATLTGEAAFYLADGYNGTQSTVVFTNATVVYTNGLSLGNAAYVMAGDSVVTLVPKTGNQARSLYLVDGANGRTASLTIKDSASLVSLGNNNLDSNAGAVLFGHYNGTSVVTVQDTASFSTLGEVLVGKTSGNNTINVSGGTFTAQGVKVSAGAGGTQALNLSGGNLVLGDIGISAYGSYTMPVNVTNSPTITASASTMPFTQPLVIGADSALNLATSASASEVTMTGAFSGDGGISVGENVTLALGYQSHPRIAALAGKLKITLSDDELSAGSITFPTTLETAPDSALISVYDGESAVTISSVSVADGVLTIQLSTPNLVTETKKVSELDPSLTGAITVLGTAENPITFDFDAALPEGVTGVTIRGSVNICGTIPWDVVTFADNAVIITTDDQSISNTVSTVSYIVRGGTLKLFPLEVSGAWKNPVLVTVETAGTLDICGYANKSYPITLAGGTLTNSGSGVGAGAMQFWNMVLTADSYLDVTNELGSIASGHGALTYTLNGHKLTKKGTGTYHISNATFAGGGTIEVLEGTMHLQKTFTVAADTTLNLVIADGATLLTEGAITKSGTLNLDNEGLWTMSLESHACPALSTKTGSGSVWIKNCSDWSPVSEGAAKMKFGYYVASGATAISTGNSGWLDFVTGGTQDFNYTLKVVDEGTSVGITFADGSQSKYKFAGLAGDGTVATVTRANSAAAYIFEDASDFSGNIVAGNRPIILGPTGASSTSGTLSVSNGISTSIGSAKYWTATNGISIAGSVNVLGPASMNGVNGSIAFLSGATLGIDGISGSQVGLTLDCVPTTAATVPVTLGANVVQSTNLKLVSWPETSDVSAIKFKLTNGNGYGMEKRSTGLYLYRYFHIKLR